MEVPKGTFFLRGCTMKRTSAILLVLMLTMAVFSSGCGINKKNASEGDALVGVIVDGPQKKAAEEYLVPQIERLIETPQMEYHFYTIFGDIDSLQKVSRWQNVVILGTLDGKDPVSLWLQERLSAEALEGVRSGEHKLFRRKNLWVRGQMVVFVVTPTPKEMREYLEQNSDVIYTILNDDRNERRFKELYALHEQKALSDSLRDAHGWTLRIPSEYKIVARGKNPDYLRMRRWFPDRFINIAWTFGTLDDVCVDTLIALRNRIGAKFADPDRVNPVILHSRLTTLGGREALRVEGIWETKGPLGGGPFVAYLLYNEGTLYLLDGQVFAPDRRKEPYIRQLDLILNTFIP